MVHANTRGWFCRFVGTQGAKFLENNTEADYRRYNEQLFDILIAGGLLGTVLQCCAGLPLVASTLALRESLLRLLHLNSCGNDHKRAWQKSLRRPPKPPTAPLFAATRRC